MEKPTIIPVETPIENSVDSDLLVTEHVVSQGETISLIAAYYGVSVQAILEANYLDPSSALFAGQKLVIVLKDADDSEDGPVMLVIHPHQEEVNLRSGPGTEYMLVDTAKGGEEVPLLGRAMDNSWLLIEYNGKEAWVYAPLTLYSWVIGQSIPVVTPPPLPPPKS